MNKTKKYLLLAANVLLLSLFMSVSVFAGAVVNCTQTEICPHAASIDNTHYDTLNEAFNAATDGQTVKLLKPAADEDVHTLLKSNYLVVEQKDAYTVYQPKDIACYEHETAVENGATFRVTDEAGEEHLVASKADIDVLFAGENVKIDRIGYRATFYLTDKDGVADINKSVIACAPMEGNWADVLLFNKKLNAETYIYPEISGMEFTGWQIGQWDDETAFSLTDGAVIDINASINEMLEDENLKQYFEGDDCELTLFTTWKEAEPEEPIGLLEFLDQPIIKIFLIGFAGLLLVVGVVVALVILNKKTVRNIMPVPSAEQQKKSRIFSIWMLVIMEAAFFINADLAHMIYLIMLVPLWHPVLMVLMNKLGLKYFRYSKATLVSNIAFNATFLLMWMFCPDGVTDEWVFFRLIRLENTVEIFTPIFYTLAILHGITIVAQIVCMIIAKRKYVRNATDSEHKLSN